MSHGAIQLMVYEELKSLAVHRGGSAAEQRAQRAHVAAWRRRQQEGGSSASSGSGDAVGEAEGPWGFRRRDAEEAVSCAPDAACASDAACVAHARRHLSPGVCSVNCGRRLAVQQWHCHTPRQLQQ